MYIRKYMDGHPYEHNEVSITTEFINQISTEHSVKSFIFTQGNEAVTGSDWLWVILTDSGVYKFLVQAKKLHRCKTYITKTQAAYMSNSGERQIELLQKYAAKTKAVPIYVLYSDRIDQFPCVKTKNDNQIGFCQPILLFLGERDSQNAVLKLCGHIFQLHALAHIKPAAAGASVALIDK